MWSISCDTGYFSQSFRECFSGFGASLREHRTSSSDDVFSERPTHHEVYTRTDTIVASGPVAGSLFKTGGHTDCYSNRARGKASPRKDRQRPGRAKL